MILKKMYKSPSIYIYKRTFVCVFFNHIHSVNPGIRIAIVNYDYINDSRRNASMQELNQAGQILAKMKMEMTRKHKKRSIRRKDSSYT